MIVTVTLNPSIDIRFQVDFLQRGGISRAREGEQTAGGKGLNVTRVLKQLNAPVIATGFLGGTNGEFIREQLEAEGINISFIGIEGLTRTCIAILENGVQTEVLGPGPRVKEEEIKCFFENYDGLVKKAEMVCISGSLPEGILSDFYRKLIEKANSYNCRVLLDTSGSPLAEGLKGKPELVKPNLPELEELLGKELPTEEGKIKGLEEVSRMGINIACLSLGKEGALIKGDKGIYKVENPPFKAKNPVGSGDAMLAGWAYGLFKGFSLEEAAIFSSACGVSNALGKKTGEIDRSQLEEISRKLKLVKIS